MKIIINAYQYSSSITGTDRMANNFLRELQKIDVENEYIVICSSEQYIQHIITAPNFRILQPKHYIKHPFVKRLINKLWRESLEYRLASIKADVYFSFHNMRLPRKRIAGKMIASNLDLIPLALDEYRDLVPGRIDEIKHSVEIADGFMSISNFSKQELHGLLKVELDKIKVIPLAADKLLAKPPKYIRELPESFIFTVGGSEPRKNVMAISQAFVNLPVNLQQKYPLLIVGGEWHGRSLEPLALSAYIKPLGYIDDATLSYLYSKASAFIFASKYEGFGFTILEAMSVGTPVISSSGTSLDEVAGKAALVFDPDSPAELTAKLHKLLSDQRLQKRLREAGKKQANEFSWQKSAKKLHKLLTTNDRLG